jgi:hypothetical protein
VKLALMFAAIAVFFFDFLFLSDYVMWAEHQCPGPARRISCQLATELVTRWPIVDLLAFASVAAVVFALLVLARRHGDRPGKPESEA